MFYAVPEFWKTQQQRKGCRSLADPNKIYKSSLKVVELYLSHSYAYFFTSHMKRTHCTLLKYRQTQTETWRFATHHFPVIKIVM